jgi:CubicO group peptidase (beta-lactamase class C family)
MAKIGQLMLNKGNWNGKQIISQKWIEKTTTTVTPTDTVNKRYGRNNASPYQFSYGYMWWLVDNLKQHPDFEGAYSATGYGGQFITVIPKLNMVIAHKTKLGLLNHLGLKYDVADWQYWQLLVDFITTK